MTNAEINLITSIVTFIALLIGFGYQLHREMKNREADEASRIATRDAVIAQAEAVAANIEEKAEAVAKALRAQAESLHSAITEGTEASKAAFHEANTVNLKLEKLGLQQQDIEKEQAAAVERDKTEKSGKS